MMLTTKTESIRILNTTISDLPLVLWLFEQAMRLQNKNAYEVWDSIDQAGLERDIENNLQYKIVKCDEILCLFSIQHNDPFIWRSRDKGDAIYLHRIVVNPKFKGQKLFKKVLKWSEKYARFKSLKYIRMDTWADNKQLIDYYKTYGFRYIESYKTTDNKALPIQNRNLNVSLLELTLD